jgi:hypothetical protein
MTSIKIQALSFQGLRKSNKHGLAAARMKASKFQCEPSSENLEMISLSSVII